MLLISLILGLIAMQFPFIAIILLWIFLAKTAVIGLQQPMRILGPFFILPLIILFVDNQTATTLQSMDSIFGVGIPALVFLYCLGKQIRTTSSLAGASLALVVYGAARSYFFEKYLYSVQIQAQEQMIQLFPNLMNQEIYVQTLNVMSLIMPGIWVATQIFAMAIGLVLFHRQLSMPFVWGKIQFPWQYNLFVLVSVVLYFFPNMQILMLTTFLGLSILPLLQGISFLISTLTRLVSNKIIRAAILIVMLINTLTIFLIATIGFIDIWFNFRKIETGGSPA